jgi:predicted RNase H-like HicB family nuclease
VSAVLSAGEDSVGTSVADTIPGSFVLPLFSPEANIMMFHVTLEKAEDGWIVAECPALPGCVSQGRDEKEALENIRESITAWMWAEDQKAMKSIPAEQMQIVAAV